MNLIFIKALQDNNQELLKFYSQIIASIVLKKIADDNTLQLSKKQKNELTDPIRNGVYDAIFGINNYRTDTSTKEFINSHALAILDSRENLTLSPKFNDTLSLLLNTNTEISFKSDFLNQEFKLGNISYNSSNRSIRISPSYSFQKVSGDVHRHRDKISSLLRKEGYMYVEGISGYIKRDFIDR